MRIILIGPPGSGKGTQAVKICEFLQIPKISTGDMLRECLKKGDAFASEIKSYIDNGLLVPDEVIFKMLEKRFEAADCQKGFLLDGFPRNVEQAKKLASYNYLIDIVILLEVPDQILVGRILERQKLENRADDTAETLAKRLQVYHLQTAPVIEWYKQRQQVDDTKFFVIDGTLTIDEVENKIKQCITPANRL